MSKIVYENGRGIVHEVLLETTNEVARKLQIAYFCTTEIEQESIADPFKVHLVMVDKANETGSEVRHIYFEVGPDGKGVSKITEQVDRTSVKILANLEGQINGTPNKEINTINDIARAKSGSKRQPS